MTGNGTPIQEKQQQQQTKKSPMLHLSNSTNLAYDMDLLVF